MGTSRNRSILLFVAATGGHLPDLLIHFSDHLQKD